MYNTPIRFDGDIIITDPCYIIREDDTEQLIHELTFEQVEKPKQEDYYSCTPKHKGLPGPEDYQDCIVLDLDDPRITPNMKDLYQSLYEMTKSVGIYNEEELAKWLKAPYSETYEKENAAYYRAWCKYDANNPRNDWEYCDYGESMENLGLKTFLCESTIYGDWSCTTFNSDTKEPIGRFCADAGQVAVFLLDEVLKYNPKFDYHLNRKWTTTLIKDFHGTVELHLEDGEDGKEVTVVGRGNVNFVGKQTGF